MKLGEALVKRSDAAKRLDTLRERAKSSVRFQEGEEPDENVEKILDTAVHTIGELEALTSAINRTNAHHAVADGVTLMDLLAQRGALSSRHSLFHNVAEAAAGGRLSTFGVRHMRSELRWLTAIPIPELRKRADKAAKEFRELDTRVQQINWETDLSE